MTGSKFAGIVIMAVSFSSMWFVLQPRSDVTLWGGLAVIFITHILYGLWIGGLLRFPIFRGEKQPPTEPSPPPAPPTFTIEYLEQEPLWRAKDETEPLPTLHDPSQYKDATFFLRVKARITAIPTLHVEDVRLEIEGGPYDPLYSNEWRPRDVSPPPYGFEASFHFEIPPSIPRRSHVMHLYARAWDDKNQKTMERTSQSFDVEIRRQALSDSSATRRTPPPAVRDAIRSDLKPLFTRGYTLLEFYKSPQNKDEEAWQEWVRDVNTFFLNSLDESYIDRWNNHDGLTSRFSLPVEVPGSNRKLHRDIDFRLQQLGEIDRELKKD